MSSEEFTRRSRIGARFLWLLIAGNLAYWAYSTLTGTGYEAATWEHFINKWNGIAVELGDADKSSIEYSNDIKSNLTNVKSGNFVAVPFSPDDHDFYLVILKDGNYYRTVHAPMSDYRENMSLTATRIWLMRIPDMPPGRYIIVGATTKYANTSSADVLSPIKLKKASFSYTSPSSIYLSK